MRSGKMYSSPLGLIPLLPGLMLQIRCFRTAPSCLERINTLGEEDNLKPSSMFIHKYNPETGEFTNLETGKVVGANQKCRYNGLWHKGKTISAHRLAFLLMGVEIPEGMDVAHINGDSHDNRWENLRLATRSESAHNAKLPKNNTSGVTGVSWHKARGKWRASITIHHEHKHLGIFEDFFQAIAARRAAEAELNPSGLCQVS